MTTGEGEYRTMGLSYADAVLLAGGRDNKIVRALDALAGGALLAATGGGAALALSLFDAKGELARLSRDLVGSLTERLRGVSRLDRTERLVAAHAVVVVTGYFEVLSETPLPFDPKRLGLSAADQTRLATGHRPDTGRLGAVAGSLLRVDVPLPRPHQPYEAVLTELRAFYVLLAGELTTFVQGLAVWDELDETARDAFVEAVFDRLPDRAVARYEENVRRLAVTCPEIGHWLSLTDHQATRAQLGAGFAALERLLTELASGRIPDARRKSLTRAYQAELGRPIISAGDLPAGLGLPSLEEGYVTPSFRVAQVSPGDSSDRIAEESWWARQPVRDDIEAFLTAFLTAPQASMAPLLVLGQPGSGKSVLTRMLAARLPADDFLVVRVPLREVPAEVDLQTQLEHAVRSATGERIDWPDLARSADGALCVVVLDGFDELLQATGVSQSDYLQQAEAFQRREADQGRPTAVIVTSRTAVADRARAVPGMVALRLEPFSDVQVARWLDTWNMLNVAVLATRGLRPLPAETVLAHADLAAQPLLLLMLALYDADDNALQRDGAALRLTELYERLLTRFVERELDKATPVLEGIARAQAIERELNRLAVVAFAMFNRRRQWVSESDLDADLAALAPVGRLAGVGMRAPLTAAQVVVGRFFFVHEAQATSDDRRLRSYEFLHATFSEYLVARLVMRELDDLVADARHAASRGRPAEPDDARLYALLSFAPLTLRATTIAFLAERMDALDPRDREQLRESLLGMFRDATEPRTDDRYREYEPWRVSVPGRCAIYSGNLLILAVHAAGELTSGELFPHATDPAYEWRCMALLWRSQLAQIRGFVQTFAISRYWDGDRREVRIRLRRDGTLADEDIDPYWAYRIRPDERSGSQGWMVYPDNGLADEANFVCAQGVDTMTYTLEPIVAELGPWAVSGFVERYDGGGVTTLARALTELWLAGADTDDRRLDEAYRDIGVFVPTGTSALRAIVARQFGIDRERLLPDTALRVELSLEATRPREIDRRWDERAPRTWFAEERPYEQW